MKATLAHMRSIEGFGPTPGFCARGGRVWAQRVGLDWSEFLREGIDVERFEAIDDAFAQAFAAHVRQVEATRG